MAKRIKLQASVGRRNLTRITPSHEAAYVATLRQQFKRITDNYEKVVESFKGKPSADILEDALRPTFELSQKYVPVATGELKDSGFLIQDTTSKFPRVILGYARNGHPHYAALVHERVDIPHASPTRSKYLLAALEEDEGNIKRRIIKGYKQLLGGA